MLLYSNVVMPESITASRNIKFRWCVNRTPSRTQCAEAKTTKGREKVYNRKEKI